MEVGVPPRGVGGLMGVAAAAISSCTPVRMVFFKNSAIQGILVVPDRKKRAKKV